ncbi:MAG: tRNA pseudouridine(38-40) synthase TruA [Proteobacteria bacterium]|nr:tRNA pseudouridine(38-40) synthase TruA [Pseudomonadota bacterium]
MTTSWAGVRIVVAYDGARLAGWQRQPGRRTVQGALEQALDRIGGWHSEVRGASRTDAGVHALGQVAAFDAGRKLEPRRWVAALNRYLPEDIAVQAAEGCARGYDPRFHAVCKTYRYLLWAARPRQPLQRMTAWHPSTLLPRTGLDTEAMRQAAQQLVGTHDFRAFQAADDHRRNTTRTLYTVNVTPCHQSEPHLMAIEVTGSAFLKNMVRILVGTLVEVGRGRLGPGDIASLLGPEGRRQAAGQTAPAHGLTLLSLELGSVETEASGSWAGSR